MGQNKKGLRIRPGKLLKKEKDSFITGKMPRGMSNFQKEDAIKNLEDGDMMKNFVCVFAGNHMNKFINFKSMTSGKTGKHPFIIGNTDSSDNDGTHWWSIFDNERKTDIFFVDLFGIVGPKTFAIQDDKSVIQKILFAFEKMTKTDCKINNPCKYKIFDERV